MQRQEKQSDIGDHNPELRQKIIEGRYAAGTLDNGLDLLEPCR